MTGECGQKLVVVLGPADPVLESTLAYVGLQMVHAAGDISVWAPLEWNPSLPISLPPLDYGQLFDEWSIPWAVSDFPCEMRTEEHHG